MSPTRILLCSDKVFSSSSDEKLQSYLYNKRNVLPVVYSWYQTNSFVDLFTLIYGAVHSSTTDTMTHRPVLSIGIMFHNPEQYMLQMFENDTARSTIARDDDDDIAEEQESKFADFKDFVRLCSVVFNIQDLDLISCRVVDNTKNTILNVIGGEINVNINASTHQEGENGNWVLEEGNVDMVGRYFNRKIKTSGITLSTSTSTIKKNSKVRILRTESFWYSQTGTVTSIDTTNIYPVTVILQNKNTNGSNTGKFALVELQLMS